MGVTIINFLMNILLVYRSIHMFFFYKNDSILTSLQLSLFL